ncbi:hypothetical protein [Streptococcus massiliensis]|uniref:hypothetical protein n=1 Tax=Streptococcus massiliensis TaxID=313439 RepID=UPI00034D35F5|nr:hypothetical protein [Streptococcus massiliensis]
MIDGSLFKNEFFDSAKKTLDLATDKMITHNFEVYDFDDVKKIIAISIILQMKLQNQWTQF